MKCFNDARRIRRLNFHKEEILPIQHDTKQVFKKVSKLTNNDHSDQYLTHENTTLLCEDFAKYFTEKIVNIRSEIVSSAEQSPDTDNTSKVNHYKNSLHTFKKVDVAELRKIMFSMNSKSDILDAIPVWLLKQCFDILAPVLLKIINM